ncbi:MAG: hypothetical protein J2P46_09220, partial [Zavarzinella sp.]|nr:hypothetical protein [Zavarzinella sp.]
TRTHPAFQTLEARARFARTAEGTGQPDDPHPVPRLPEPRKLPELGHGKTEAKGSEVFGQESKSVPPKPAKSPGDDPFDPAIFNGAGKTKK